MVSGGDIRANGAPRREKFVILPDGVYIIAIWRSLRITVEAYENRESPETADILSFQKKLQSGDLASHAYVTLLGMRSCDVSKLMKKVESGLSYNAFSRFQRNIDLSTQELAEMVQIKPRTLARRKRSGRLDAAESDRLLRAARVFADAIRLFEGDAAAARAWLASPLRALGDRSPLVAVRTEVGAREVEKLIGRLEHGVFA